MDNKKGLVSILVITYNAEKFIHKTIQSCLNQSYDNFEILILDNKSQDKTVDVIKKIHDNRIKLFRSKTNLGPYGGLNFLLNKASGEYIAIQDHDDIWLSKKMEKQIKFLKNNREFIACGTATWYYFEKKKLLILNEKPKVTDFVDHTSLLFRNKGFRYKENFILADEHFEKKILSQEGKIACLTEGLTVHRLKENGSNLSENRFRISFVFLREFFYLNGFNKNSLMYLSSMFVGKFLPAKIIWFIRLKVTQKNHLKLSLNTFQKKYPSVKI
jgi:glycosyltransferase involved in cell wall biosynthesis